MIQIRKCVFETNSSSSHSIVLTKNEKPVNGIIDAEWRVNKDGVMDFWFEEDLEFGRTPFELLADWNGRLRYAIATYGDDKEKLEELESICRKRVKGFKSFKFSIDEYGREEHGYIDHQSLGLLAHTLKKYNVSLEDFIFDDRFIIVVDGDEYNIFMTLMETELFNKDNVRAIEPASYEIEREYFGDSNDI